MSDELDRHPVAARAADADAVGRRDPRLDLLRGFFVFHMFLVHLGWRSMSPHYTLGWMTAAEGFFFVSGATLGLVAGRRAGTPGAAELRRKLALRGVWLYLLNLAVVATAYLFGVTPYFRQHGIEKHWSGQPAWLRLACIDHPMALDVLPRYAVFLLLAPLALLLVERRRGPLWLALGSGALWLANWWTGNRLLLPGVELPRSAFTVASWQLLFFGGIAVTSAWPPRFDRARRSSGLRTALFFASLAATIAFVVLDAGATDRSGRTRGPLAVWVDHSTLGPLRMVNFVVVAVLLWVLVDRFREPLARWLGGVLLPLGRNALPAFVLHLPLLWIGNAIQQPQGGWWMRRLAALASALAISQIVRWKRLRKLLLPV